MRAKELRERTNEDLVKMCEEEREKLFRYRLQNATHQLDDTSKMRKARSEIARIYTALKERSGFQAQAKEIEKEG